MPTEAGELKTIFEFELFGTGVDAGQTTFRLRHAWGELGQVGAGQTWSPFMDIDVFPNSVEYWGPNGMVFFRNVQLRWTPWSNGQRLPLRGRARAARAPAPTRATTPTASSSQASTAASRCPTSRRTTARAGDWGHVQVAGIVRQIEVGRPQRRPVRSLSGDAPGWGINVSSNIKLGNNVLRLQSSTARASRTT